MKKIFILGQQEQAQNYFDAITLCGAAPVFGTDLTNAYECDALLLIGGADMNPLTYGEENTKSKDISDTRDSLELELILYFAEQNKPIMGICRGIQVLNVALGGSLIQHIETADSHFPSDNNEDKLHIIKLNGQSFLNELYGDSFPVNSYHHQAIKIPADNLNVIAYATDGIVEGVMHKTKPIFAVQWHPERMMGNLRSHDTVDGKALFDYFISTII